jgi:hypothetical protein
MRTYSQTSEVVAGPELTACSDVQRGKKAGMPGPEEHRDGSIPRIPIAEGAWCRSRCTSSGRAEHTDEMNRKCVGSKKQKERS